MPLHVHVLLFPLIFSLLKAFPLYKEALGCIRELVEVELSFELWKLSQTLSKIPSVISWVFGKPQVGL